MPCLRHIVSNLSLICLNPKLIVLYLNMIFMWTKILVSVNPLNSILSLRYHFHSVWKEPASHLHTLQVCSNNCDNFQIFCFWIYRALEAVVLFFYFANFGTLFQNIIFEFWTENISDLDEPSSQQCPSTRYWVNIGMSTKFRRRINYAHIWFLKA